MKMEHCKKCKKQIEVVKPKKEISSYSKDLTKFIENNEVSFAPREQSASVYTEHYCNGCYYDILYLLADKGYITHDDASKYNSG